MPGRIRTPEEVVARGGWTECGCGIPSRARYHVVLVVGRDGPVGQGNIFEIDWYACSDHLVRDEPDRMVHPDIRAKGFVVLNTRITDKRKDTP